MKQQNPRDDQGGFSDLMKRVADGSEDAAWLLVEGYGDRLRRAVRRSLPEGLRSKFDSMDFVQLVWASFFRLRGNTGRHENPRELAAFLMRMARNKVAMEIRHRATQKNDFRRERRRDGSFCVDQGDVVVLSSEVTAADVAIAKEQWERMIADRPQHYRRIVEMRLQGYTYDEIAEQLDIDKSTVYRFLKKLLQQVGG